MCKWLPLDKQYQISPTNQEASCLNASTSAFKLPVTLKWLHLQKSAVGPIWESGGWAKSLGCVSLCCAVEKLEVMKKPFVVIVSNNSKTINCFSLNLLERYVVLLFPVCYSQNVSVPVDRLPRHWVCLVLLGHVHNLSKCEDVCHLLLLPIPYSSPFPK